MKTLVIVTGPTGSGKTQLAIEIAESLHTEIVSADSRQIFMDIPIATAAPTPEEMARVTHHMVGMLPLDSYYSAACYEEDALKILNEIWQRSDYAVMCGGSMMYIDVITNGIDRLPTVSESVRANVLGIYDAGGLDALCRELERLDPDYLAGCDRTNPRRLIHAIEVSVEAGVPYSSLLTGEKVNRPFRVVKLAIGHTRQQLFDRINRRVGAMVAQGLEEEARRVYPLRHLNSLNTVGFKEMFAYFDGIMDRDTAIARIAKNTRVYAKKQLLWLSKDPSVITLTPTDTLLAQALAAIDSATR